MKMNKLDIVVHQKLKTRKVELYRETIDADSRDFHSAMEFVERLYPDYNIHTISVEHWVEKTNLMTGETYVEAPNTPLFCSPASESYWAM